MNDIYGITTVHPIGLLALLLLGFFMLKATKGGALISFIILGCFISPAQRIVLGGLDLNFIRILVLFGILRIYLRNEQIHFRWEPTDKLMIAWAISKTILYTIQRHGDSSATIYQLGNAFEALGVYFIVRILTSSIADLKLIIKSVLLLSLPICVFFLIESKTGRNFFSFLGGVSEYSIVRDGRVRATGAFAHPILAGSFFASTVPIAIAYCLQRGQRRGWPYLGLIAILMIVILCASSTPILGLLFALIGMAFFALRFDMRTIQKLIVLGIIGLSIVMKNPIWHLLARIDIAGGSTGYYRYLLIDKAIKHFPDWALVGVPGTGYWSDAGGENMSDIVNQYILEGVDGGALSMALFIAVIVACFGIIGRIIKARTLDRNDQLMVWSLGASLFTHSMMFLVVSYFGQIVMLWNLVLGLIVSMASIYLSRAKEDAAAEFTPELEAFPRAPAKLV